MVNMSSLKWRLLEVKCPRCEIGFGFTHTYSLYSKKYGIVAPGGVMTMIARKPS